MRALPLSAGRYAYPVEPRKPIECTRSQFHSMFKKLLTIALSALIAVAGAIIVANLALGNKKIDAPIAQVPAVDDPQFERVMGSLLTPGLVAGNRAQELLNGVQIFPAMLDAIRSAERTITLETYIYFAGDTGARFSAALRERAQKGVKVYLLLDWYGGQIDEEMLESLRRSGVQVRRYNPPIWYNLAWMNNRTHRKLMVVDGKIGFIGGVGLADQWSGDAQGPGHWRDTHFKVEGPVVAQMQSAFADNWLQTTGQLLHSDAYFPALAEQGSTRAQVFRAAPAGAAQNMQLLYLMSITAAARSIDLSASYFVPDEVARQSLASAAKRGVRVRIIVPGPHMDQAIVRHASRNNWGELLEAGVEIYEYQPTMFHCKVMVVDALWTTVGSTNFTSRSFSVNDEANMNVYDSAFAARQGEVFEQDLAQSQRITLEAWRERPWTQKLLDWAASLTSSQL